MNKLQALLRANGHMKSSFRADVSTDTNQAVIYLYTLIGKAYDWETGETVGMSDIEFIQMLNDIAAKGIQNVKLCVNSPGGDVFQAKAMQTAMMRFPGTITACVDSLAASAAASLIMSAKSIEMAPHAFIMIHKAWTYACGNSDDLTGIVSMLNGMDNSIASDFANKTGMKSDEIMKMMKECTYINAQTAIEQGFCDCITEPAADPVQNRWDLSVYGEVPELLRVNPAEVERLSPKTITKTYDLEAMKRKLTLVERGI